MEDLTFARAVHVLAVVIWIGGVSMVTTLIIPAIKKLKTPVEQIQTFEQIEGRFSIQARVTTLLTGLSGFYMIYKLDAWDRYLHLQFWWIHAMTLVWLLFTVVLFILEPFVLHKKFKQMAMQDPKKTFAVMQRAHWLLLTISLITVFAAVAGSHGWFFIG